MLEDLYIIDQFPFTFYGETFYALLVSDRHLYIPIARVCQVLDIDVNAQVQRIRRDEAISDSVRRLSIEVPYGDKGATREQEMNCLDLRRLPYWLGGIDANRIKNDDLRERVVAFKRDFADVAWAAFRTEILPDDVLAEMDMNLPPERQAYLETMDAAAEMRRQLGKHDEQIIDHEERLGNLEARLEGTEFLTPQQARQVQTMATILAELLRKRDKGDYHTVYGEIKREFQVPSYKLVPEDKFPRLQSFLAQWHSSLTIPGTPLPQVFKDPSQGRLF